MKERLAETIIEYIGGVAASQTAIVAEQVAPEPTTSQVEAPAKANL